MITTLTGKHQVTVPAEIVSKAGMKPGTHLEWRTTNRKNILEVRVLPDAASLARSIQGRGKARRGGSAVTRLIEERRRENVR